MLKNNKKFIIKFAKLGVILCGLVGFCAQVDALGEEFQELKKEVGVLYDQQYVEAERDILCCNSPFIQKKEIEELVGRISAMREDSKFRLFCSTYGVNSRITKIWEQICPYDISSLLLRCSPVGGGRLKFLDSTSLQEQINLSWKPAITAILNDDCDQLKKIITSAFSANSTISHENLAAMASHLPCPRLTAEQFSLTDIAALAQAEKCVSVLHYFF